MIVFQSYQTKFEIDSFLNLEDICISDRMVDGNENENRSGRDAMNS